MPRCANCNLFQWDQPADSKTLRKCTRCHVVSYCGQECQLEYWTKVHQEQCSYLAGTKKAWKHRRETCRTCIASSSLGDLVFSPTNPNYVCIFENVDWSMLPPTYPHPFPLHYTDCLQPSRGREVPLRGKRASREGKRQQNHFQPEEARGKGREISLSKGTLLITLIRLSTR